MTSVLHVHFHRHFASFEAHFHFVNHLGDAVFDHDFGNFEGSVSYCQVNQSAFVSYFSLFFCSCLHAFFIVSAQFFNGFEIAVSCNVFVGQFRQYFAFNVLDVYFEYSFFTSQFSYEVFGREGYFYVSGITFGQANQLVFKAGDEGVRANFQRIAFAFAAAESFAVNSTSKVDDCEVAFFDYSAFFCNYHFSVAVAQVVHSSFQIFVGYNSFLFFNVQAFVFAQFRFRFQSNFDNQFHVLTFFEHGSFYFRVINGDKFLEFQCFAVNFVSYHFESFLFNSFFAIVHFDNVTGSFAFTEARDIYALSNFLNSLFKAIVYNCYFSSNFQSCFITYSFNGYVHE